MAIARIKKIKIAAHNSIKNELLDVLQDLGMVHISQLQQMYHGLPVKDNQAEEGLVAALSQLDEMLKYMHSFEKKKSSFGEKIIIKLEELKSVHMTFDYRNIYEIILNLKNLLKDMPSQKEKLRDRKKKLLPWQSLGSLSLELEGTQHARVAFGTMRPEDYVSLLEEIEREKLAFHSEVINEKNARSYVVCAYLKQEELALWEILKKNNFNKVSLDIENPNIEQELTFLQTQYETLAQKESSALEELKTLRKYKIKLMCLYDCYVNLKKKDESKKSLLYTKEAFLVEGWIKKRDEKQIRKTLENKFTCFELSTEEPQPDDIIPVELENAKVLSPFEFVTNIYGLPAYGELDPTPLFAPFFFLFFGFCLTDAGYGVVLAVLSIWALLKFKMGRYWKTFFKLLCLGGISTVVLGAVTGGWFGNIIDILYERFPTVFAGVIHIRGRLILLDPNKEPIKLLAIALGIGITQIFVGNLIAFYDNIRKRHFVDGILDQASVLIFLTGFSGLILVMFEVVDKKYNGLCGKLAIAGGSAIILFAGRANPGIGAKLFSGIFTFYNTAAGYISDVLSYSRLWALGLVTGVMAMTCNIIAFMIGDMIPFVGFIVTALILIAGHTFTMAINILGGLIHSGRLQFVEFFPKFFKGGGKAFTPFRMEHKYTVIEK
ncbi:MAG: V-type ATP synthase subunit I [Candidatus Omnitrophota bacterium]